MGKFFGYEEIRKEKRRFDGGVWWLMGKFMVFYIIWVFGVRMREVKIELMGLKVLLLIFFVCK